MSVCLRILKFCHFFKFCATITLTLVGSAPNAVPTFIFIQYIRPQGLLYVCQKILKLLIGHLLLIFSQTTLTLIGSEPTAIQTFLYVHVPAIHPWGLVSVCQRIHRLLIGHLNWTRTNCRSPDRLPVSHRCSYTSNILWRGYKKGVSEKFGLKSKHQQTEAARPFSPSIWKWYHPLDNQCIYISSFIFHNPGTYSDFPRFKRKLL